MDLNPPAVDARRRRRDWIAFLAIAVGSFVAILDVQIVASSLDEIRAGLSASVDEIQWVQTSYLIAEIIAIPLSGYLAPMMSTRVFFTIAAVGFTLSSLACGFSWSLGSIIVFRALQGFLGGGLIPALFATLFLLFPGQKDRTLSQLVAGMTTLLAPAVGPTFGGWITDALSWRWLFLINFIPGIGCAVVVWAMLDIDKPKPQMLKNLDIYGVLLLALFLGSLEYALDDGPRHDWFDDQAVLVTTVLAVAGGALFFWRVFKSRQPIVDLRAFRNRNFTVTSLVSAMLGISMFTLNYITPLFLGEVAGYNAQQIGSVMMVGGLSMIFLSPLVIRLEGVLDPRVTIAIGVVLVAAGSYANAALTGDWGGAQFLLPQVLRGAGMIFTFVPMTNLALGTLPPAELNNASALYSVTRNLGGALGLALVATLMNQRSWNHWQALAESTNMSRPAVRDWLSATVSALHPQLGQSGQAGAMALLAQEASRQVATMTYSDMYLLLAISTLVAAFLIPLIRKPAQGAATMGH
jgi:MFS transporter, DHA2 family, multidrug resistance protein